MTSFLISDEIPTLERGDEVQEDSIAVKVSDGSFGWEEGSGAFLSNINFDVKKGELFAIVGAVGTGKSTLLLSILSETKKFAGRVTLHGKVAYMPQQPWIFQGTVRYHILH